MHDLITHWAKGVYKLRRKSRKARTDSPVARTGRASDLIYHHDISRVHRHVEAFGWAREWAIGYPGS